MFLCVDREILTIFGHPDAAVQDDLIYICYLNMARAGLLALEVYGIFASLKSQLRSN
jgi:dipeptidyl-peptidase-3